LCAHIISKHPEFHELGDNDQINQIKLEECSYTVQVRQIYGWVRWIVMSLLPFSFCEDAHARLYSNLENISLNTFMKYMQQLCRIVEKKISNILPDKFAIVFDGWTSNQTHYVGVFCTFPSDVSPNGFSKVLLSFSPMGEEDSLSVNQHVLDPEFESAVVKISSNNRESLTQSEKSNC
jgi:hypothetical protein